MYSLCFISSNLFGCRSLVAMDTIAYVSYALGTTTLEGHLHPTSPIADEFNQR